MLRVTRHDERTLLVHGPFRPEQWAHLSNALESARTVRLPHTALRAAATLHNARVIDACPGGAAWQCDKPAPPVTARDDSVPALMKTAPYAHQLQEYLRSRDMPAFAFCWEMGTGKTKVAIDTAAHLFAAGKIDRVLVSTIKGVHRQWAEEEVPKHCAVPHHAVTWRQGGLTAAATAELEAALANREVLVFLCMNVDALVTGAGSKLATEFARGGPCLFVVDEAHTIKTPSAERTKAVTRLGQLCAYRRTLTGTPITRGTEDLFAQYRFLDPNIIGSRTFAAFVGEYCVFGGYQNKAIVGYRNIDKLNALIAPYTSRVEKEDCLDLPPKVMMRREVPLSEEQAAAYREARDAFRQALESPSFNITTAMELLVRLRQVVGGHLPDDTPLACPRVDAVVDMVREARGRVVVWAVHRAEVARVAKALRALPEVVVRVYDGTVSERERAEALATYAQDPRCVLVANPAAGGTGLNLDGARLVIYYSHSFNAAHRWQSEDRTHRATTRHTVTYVDMVAPRTVEERALAGLARKQGLADMTLAELRETFRQPGAL
jgi:superfamily II DNA or RNA helicase